MAVQESAVLMGQQNQWGKALAARMAEVSSGRDLIAKLASVNALLAANKDEQSQKMVHNNINLMGRLMGNRDVNGQLIPGFAGVSDTEYLLMPQSGASQNSSNNPASSNGSNPASSSNSGANSSNGATNTETAPSGSNGPTGATTSGTNSEQQTPTTEPAPTETNAAPVMTPQEQMQQFLTRLAMAGEEPSPSDKFNATMDNGLGLSWQPSYNSANNTPAPVAERPVNTKEQEMLKKVLDKARKGAKK